MEHRSELNKLEGLIPDDVWEILVDHRAILAGGAITSLFTNREINDLDIYFPTKEDMIGAIRDIFDGSYPLHCANYTDKSILFFRNEGGERQDYQFIHFRDFPDYESIFDSFDFTVCMGAFDFRRELFVFNEDFFKHNSQRYLKYNPGTDFPLLSALRVDKYKEKGYNISKTEYLRVVLNAANLGIDSWDQFKEHVGGFYGLNMDEVFDEEKEFTLDEAISQLSNISASQFKDEFKSVNLGELMWAINGRTPRFFKFVREENGNLVSRIPFMGNKLTYNIGETVNGGENGIYCFHEWQDGPYGKANREFKLIELEPDGKKWEIKSHESQLFGDVRVKRIVDQDEVFNEDGDLPF